MRIFAQCIVGTSDTFCITGIAYLLLHGKTKTVNLLLDHGLNPNILAFFSDNAQLTLLSWILITHTYSNIELSSEYAQLALKVIQQGAIIEYTTVKSHILEYDLEKSQLILLKHEISKKISELPYVTLNHRSALVTLLEHNVSGIHSDFFKILLPKSSLENLTLSFSVMLGGIPDIHRVMCISEIQLTSIEIFVNEAHMKSCFYDSNAVRDTKFNILDAIVLQKPIPKYPKHILSNMKTFIEHLQKRSMSYSKEKMDHLIAKMWQETLALEMEYQSYPQKSKKTDEIFYKRLILRSSAIRTLYSLKNINTIPALERLLEISRKQDGWSREYDTSYSQQQNVLLENLPTIIETLKRGEQLQDLLRAHQRARDPNLPSSELTFRRAAFDGDLELIKTLVKLDPNLDINGFGPSGKTALDFAIQKNHIDVMRYLLETKELTSNFVIGRSPKLNS
jgi:hypothetical protein